MKGTLLIAGTIYILLLVAFTMLTKTKEKDRKEKSLFFYLQGRGFMVP